MITAKVIADSTNQFGNRITTMVVTMPRIILAEFNTHRMFSRNSAPSLEIPFEKIVKSVEENPFIPIAWQTEHKGMQGSEYITCNANLEVIEQDWLEARDFATRSAKRLNEGFQYNIDDENEIRDKVTKQLCNHLLEPFMWHTVIVTATEWENFFSLRCPQYDLGKFIDGETSTYRSRKDLLKNGIDYEPIGSDSELFWLQRNKGQAEIHMMALAEAMWDAYCESTPRVLAEGEWHVPFGGVIQTIEEYNKLKETYGETFAIKASTARCARVSYTVVGAEGKEHSYEDDIKLHDSLLKSRHMSPFEHCARCTQEGLLENGFSGNFRGWEQYRKMVE